MGPHADDLNYFTIIQYLVDKAVLDVDSPRACSREIADKLFIWRRRLVWVFCEEIEETRCVRFQT